MITLYTGSVGSGKSFHAVDLGLQWIAKKHVIANFPINEKKRRFATKKTRRKDRQEFERWHYDDEITIPKLMALSIEQGWIGKESQCLLLIDEAGVIFNSRDWQIQGNERMKWIKFMSQSRKLGYDIVLVCQFDRMIDKQIRSLVEYEVKHLKANNSFMFSFLSMFKVTLFMYVYRWYQTKLKSNLRFGRYRKSIADRYDTMRTFNIDELVEEIEKLYTGTVIPAPVAFQLDMWRSEVEERKRQRAAVAEGGEGAGGFPADSETEAENDQENVTKTSLLNVTSSDKLDVTNSKGGNTNGEDGTSPDRKDKATLFDFIRRIMGMDR